MTSMSSMVKIKIPGLEFTHAMSMNGIHVYGQWDCDENCSDYVDLSLLFVQCLSQTVCMLFCFAVFLGESNYDFKFFESSCPEIAKQFSLAIPTVVNDALSTAAPTRKFANGSTFAEIAKLPIHNLWGYNQFVFGCFMSIYYDSICLVIYLW